MFVCANFIHLVSYALRTKSQFSLLRTLWANVHKVNNTRLEDEKMAKIRNNSNWIILLPLLICVQCSFATKFQPNFVEFDQIKHDLYSMRDFNISNLISEMWSHANWRENRECLMELTAIKHGFDVFDEWAVKRKEYSTSFQI